MTDRVLQIEEACASGIQRCMEATAASVAPHLLTLRAAVPLYASFRAQADLQGLLLGALAEAFAEGYSPLFPERPRETVEFQRSLRHLLSYNFHLIHGIDSELAEGLRAILRKAVVGKLRREEVEEEVRRLFQTTGSRAETIARTEIQRAHNAGIYEAMRAKGVRLKRWSAKPEQYPLRTCVWCFLLHGAVLPLNEIFDGGRHGVVLHPPLHPMCRCRIISHFRPI